MQKLPNLGPAPSVGIKLKATPKNNKAEWMQSRLQRQLLESMKSGPPSDIAIAEREPLPTVPVQEIGDYASYYQTPEGRAMLEGLYAESQALPTEQANASRALENVLASQRNEQIRRAGSSLGVNRLARQNIIGRETGERAATRMATDAAIKEAALGRSAGLAGQITGVDQAAQEAAIAKRAQDIAAAMSAHQANLGYGGLGLQQESLDLQKELANRQMQQDYMSRMTEMLQRGMGLGGSSGGGGITISPSGSSKGKPLTQNTRGGDGQLIGSMTGEANLPKMAAGGGTGFSAAGRYKVDPATGQSVFVPDAKRAVPGASPSPYTNEDLLGWNQ